LQWFWHIINDESSKDTENGIRIKIEKKVTWVMNRNKMGEPVTERRRREVMGRLKRLENFCLLIVSDGNDAERIIKILRFR
jgi:hypothetical protein